ncbi:hypothetical protein QIS99_28850 [Streptomyces sp. B-S-A8]|uniref:Uncharacterized protein n=1 Tax=Streptomyces solicavernae TaxID=3043614 RepID=A0ABT6S0E8_9ACTN|nr:hypothetical protein [Streptomyces sp. B-S-A8]MDI3390170.1 hypothetical protein [Streptomyces sp. B-S-A8]
MAAAQPQAADVEIDSGGLGELLRDDALNIVVLIAGLSIVLLGKKRDIAGAFTIGAIVLLGLGVVGLATGTTASDVGEAMVGLVTTEG